MDGTKQCDLEAAPEHSTHEVAAPTPPTDPDIGPPQPSPIISEKSSVSAPRSRHNFRGAIGRKRPYRKAVYPILIRWTFILLLVAAMYAVLYSYSKRVVMSRRDKRIFNALVTGIAIALALLTISFLNHIVIDLRWWMLGRRFRSRRKVQAIMHAHSLRQAVILAYSSRRLTLHMIALSWVLLLLASQVALASINLCFSLESNEADALRLPGNVTIPDLQIIHTNQVIKSSKSIGAQQYTANSFGTISLGFGEGDFDAIPRPGTLFYADDDLVFCDHDLGACRYQFHEANTDSISDPVRIPIKSATDRSVRVTSDCQSYPVLRGGDGSAPEVEIDLRNGAGGRRNVTIPIQGGSDQSTFFTNTSETCGRGCAELTILEASDVEQAWLYECTVSIGRVDNVRLPAHEIGEQLAQMAAGSIALQGYASATPAGVSGNVSGADLVVQVQVYPAESSWGSPVNGSTTLMAYVLSRFATGVVAIAAESAENFSPVVVLGMAPHIGIRVKMEHWPIVHAILILTAAVQLVMGLTAAWLANLVVVPDSGPVPEAQVLRAMMPDGERGGRLKKGDSGRRGGGTLDGRKTVWIYRDEYVGGGLYDLYMDEEEVAVPVTEGRSMFWWLQRKDRRPSQQSQLSQATSRGSTASMWPPHQAR